MLYRTFLIKNVIVFRSPCQMMGRCALLVARQLQPQNEQNPSVLGQKELTQHSPCMSFGFCMCVCLCVTKNHVSLKGIVGTKFRVNLSLVLCWGPWLRPSLPLSEASGSFLWIGCASGFFLLCFQGTTPCLWTHSGSKHLNLVFDEFLSLLQVTFSIMSSIYLLYESSNPEEPGLSSKLQMLCILSWTFVPTCSPCLRWMSFSFPQLHPWPLQLLWILRTFKFCLFL